MQHKDISVAFNSLFAQHIRLYILCPPTTVYRLPSHLPYHISILSKQHPVTQSGTTDAIPETERTLDHSVYEEVEGTR